MKLFLFIFALIVVLYLLAVDIRLAVAGYAPGCSASCVARVKARIIRQHERQEWHSYKRHPMPWCTWVPESGAPRPGYGPWAHRRYRVVNSSSGAAGKFQIMLQTWLAYGGGQYAPSANQARRLHQERVARRIAFAGTVSARPQGLGAWVNC